MSRMDTPMAHAVLTLDTVVVASPEQVSSKLGEEVVILNLRNGVYYGLDPIGTRIWELIQEPRSVRQVCEVLLEEYDVTFEQCAEDVLALMRDLQAQGLIETRDAQARKRPPAEIAGRLLPVEQGTDRPVDSRDARRNDRCLAIEALQATVLLPDPSGCTPRGEPEQLRQLYLQRSVRAKWVGVSRMQARSVRKPLGHWLHRVGCSGTMASRVTLYSALG